jgi:RND family efflux transporter MFP subunit
MVEGTVKGSCLISLAAALALLNPVSASATEPVRGFTRCAADLQLSFPLAGRISGAQVREGSLVKKGDLLMQLDRAAEELDVERRKVQWQGTADLLVAQARHETAVKQLAAARTIFNENRGVSMEEVQNRELAVRTTQAELERVKTLKETERLDYQTALENLERRNLVAGTSGIVTRIIKQAGESAQAYEAVLRLCDLSRVEFMANMPTEQTGRLREGQAVKVQVSSVPPATVSARVTFVSPVVDPASGLREVKADLINPPAWVRPGESAVLQRK